MRTLVIDTATEACSVALFEDDVCLAGEWRMLGRGHAENLIPMVAALPNRGCASRIAVSVGPGSFTGVRVGLAAGRALSFAWDAAIVGYTTPSLIAAMAREQEGRQAVSVAMTGGHGEWFIARFGEGGETLLAPTSLRPDEAAAECIEACVAGNQATALVATRCHGLALELWPDARRFALLPPGDLIDDPIPVYGRPPDAKVSVR